MQSWYWTWKEEQVPAESSGHARAGTEVGRRSRYQRSLLDMIFMGDNANRSKFNCIIAGLPTPSPDPKILMIETASSTVSLPVYPDPHQP